MNQAILTRLNEIRDAMSQTQQNTRRIANDGIEARIATSDFNTVQNEAGVEQAEGALTPE